MDQSLKARLIGATVLVILAVLLIPELLSGRTASGPPAQDSATNDHRTFTIDIGRSGGTMTAPAVPQPQPAPTAAPGPDATATGIVSVAGSGGAASSASAGGEAGANGQPRPDKFSSVSPASAADTTTPAPSAAVTTPVPAAPPGVPAPAVSRSGRYFVQVGAFGSGDAARKLVAQLEADGYATQVAPVTRGGKTLHRVRVGPAASRADAQQLAERLKSRGLPATLVTSE